MDLPFRAEYSKSNRAKCKACKESIDQGILRMATLTQSAFFDGKQPNWYHFNCFFNKQRVKSTDDIEHFESLRIKDQDRIKSHLLSTDLILPTNNKATKGKGKKRSAADKEAEKAKIIALKDFLIEYSKSSRATCRGCEQKILKDEVRVSKKEFESDAGRKIGGIDRWHHLNCFAELRSEFGFYEGANKIPGFEDLDEDTQEEALKAIPAIKQENLPSEAKKIKIETKTKEETSLEQEYREQNKLMFSYRDKLKTQLKKPQLILLLEYNGQQIPEGVERILDLLSDIMTFGALKSCQECRNGQLVFGKSGYMCSGNISEWAKCSFVTKNPERSKFRVPDELMEIKFLRDYKHISGIRVIKEVIIPSSTTTVKKEVKDEVDSGPKIKRAAPALLNMEFFILCKPERGKDELKKEILRLGGKVVTKITKCVMAIFGTKELVEKMGSKMIEAEFQGIHVITEDFIDEASENIGKIPDLIKKKSICSWGTDPTKRLPSERSSSTLKSKSRFTSSVPSKVKLKLKGGSAVDPDSGLENEAHVYEDINKEKWTAVLGITDVQNNKNSYYKLQVLQSDKQTDKFWLFRSWGRIGTTCGGSKVEKKSSLYLAQKAFKELYEEKSGNEWKDRHNFVKVPNRMYPIDIDYGEDIENLDIVESESKLTKEVQNLIKLLFDIEQMKELMLEFELDMEKMPLGKLSRNQIQKAYGVLSELQNFIDHPKNEAVINERRFIEATNRFYTLIPHNFGVDAIPILNDKDTVKQKLDMLDTLLEMEVAYSLMKNSGDNKHTVDGYYEQLKADIGVLQKNAEEFEIIKEYVKNTHASTHNNYELDVEEVFVVKREGEDSRYKPFRKLPNRKLLWHGSRTTNFAGILSQGLRIAPAEAPVTGYMFGKGIYFADMVSKSANYCCTTPNKPTGLLLLCEVALGKVHEKLHAEYLDKPPKGYHSVKGCGKTHPDPALIKKINGDVEVPLGKGVAAPGTEHSSLLYNEFIVYDIAQVRIKYLVKANFKYKY